MRSKFIDIQMKITNETLIRDKLLEIGTLNTDNFLNLKMEAKFYYPISINQLSKRDWAELAWIAATTL